MNTNLKFQHEGTTDLGEEIYSATTQDGSVMFAAKLEGDGVDVKAHGEAILANKNIIDSDEFKMLLREFLEDERKAFEALDEADNLATNWFNETDMKTVMDWAAANGLSAQQCEKESDWPNLIIGLKAAEIRQSMA